MAYSNINIPSNTTFIPVDTRTNNLKVLFLPVASTNQGRILIFKDYYGTCTKSSFSISTTGYDLIDDYNRVATFRSSFMSMSLLSDGLVSWRVSGLYNNILFSSTINFMYPGSGYTWYDTRFTSGTTLTDKGIGVYNGTMSTTIPTIAGPYAGMVALAFPAGATISCPTGYTTSDFTISYWVYFIDKTQSGGTSTYQYVVTGGRLTTQQYYNNTNIAYDAGGTVAFGQLGAVWTQLTYVYTTSGTTNITVYKNGSQIATANVAISAAATWQFASTLYTFQSYLADIRIVPFKLTAAQALALYQSYASGEWSLGY